MGGFYAAVITGKEAVPYVPRPLDAGEAQELLHLQTFSIPADCDIPTGTRVSVMLKAEDDPPACVCTLTVGAHDSMLTSVMLEAYAELSLVCSNKKALAKAAVHATGIFAPTEGEGSDGERADDGDVSATQMLQQRLAADLNGLIGKSSGLGEVDDEDDDDEDDEDYDEDGDDEDEKIVTRYGGRKHVEITELPEGDDEDDSDEDSEEDGADAENQGAPNGTTLEGKGQQVGAAAAAMANAARTESAAAVKAEADGDDSDDESDSAEEPDPAAALLPATTRGATAATNGAAAAAAAKDDDEDDESDSDESDEGSDDENAMAADAPAELPANGKRKASGEAVPTSSKKQKKTAFANGFEVHEVATGPNPKAAMAVPGKRVAVRYTGTLQASGKVFDKTKGNKTFSFRLGVGDVIKGWDKGLAGMRVGDKRKLVVPASMAYGETGVRNVIPKNATLLFDVELVNVQ